MKLLNALGLAGVKAAAPAPVTKKAASPTPPAAPAAATPSGAAPPPTPPGQAGADAGTPSTADSVDSGAIGLEAGAPKRAGGAPSPFAGDGGVPGLSMSERVERPWEAKNPFLVPPKAPPRASPAEITALAELGKQIKQAAGNAIVRDPLVKKLRDGLVRLQPFLPKADAKKLIDDAIKDAVGSGALAALRAVLTLAAGKPTTMPADRSNVGPGTPQKDLQEKMLTTPAIPFGGGATPHRSTFFEFRNVKKTYPRSKFLTVTLVMRDGFETGAGNPRVELVDAAGSVVGNEAAITRKDREDISIAAPDAAGTYRLRVHIGSEVVADPQPEFKVE